MNGPPVHRQPILLRQGLLGLLGHLSAVPFQLECRSTAGPARRRPEPWLWRAAAPPFDPGAIHPSNMFTTIDRPNADTAGGPSFAGQLAPQYFNRAREPGGPAQMGALDLSGLFNHPAVAQQPQLRIRWCRPQRAPPCKARFGPGANCSSADNSAARYALRFHGAKGFRHPDICGNPAKNGSNV